MCLKLRSYKVKWFWFFLHNLRKWSKKYLQLHSFLTPYSTIFLNYFILYSVVNKYPSFVFLRFSGTQRFPICQFQKSNMQKTISIIYSYFPQMSHVKFETYIYWKLIATIKLIIYTVNDNDRLVGHEEKNQWSEKEGSQETQRRKNQ